MKLPRNPKVTLGVVAIAIGLLIVSTLLLSNPATKVAAQNAPNTTDKKAENQKAAPEPAKANAPAPATIPELSAAPVAAPVPGAAPAAPTPAPAQIVSPANAPAPTEPGTVAGSDDMQLSFQGAN